MRKETSCGLSDGWDFGSGFSRTGVEYPELGMDGGKEGGIVPNALTMSSIALLSSEFSDRSRNCNVTALDR
jgi:hypothetical protein